MGESGNEWVEAEFWERHCVVPSLHIHFVNALDMHSAGFASHVHHVPCILWLLFCTGLEEGGFPIPNGDLVVHSEDSKDRTIMVMGELPQKISVRVKPSVEHKGMQTDPEQLHYNGPPKQQKEAGISPDNTFLQPTPLSPCPSPVLSRKKAYVKWENKDFSQKAEPSTIRPSYQELEQVRETIPVSCELSHNMMLPV